MNKNCICPATQNPCPKCGRKWEYAYIGKDGKTTYTSREVVEKYKALYGKPETFQIVPV